MQRLDIEIEPDFAAVQPAHRQFDAAALPVREGLGQRLPCRQAGLTGAEHGIDRLPQNLRPGVAGQPGEALVDPVDALPAVGRQHGVVGVPHHRRQALQVGGQALGQRLGARAQRCLLAQQEGQRCTQQQAGQRAADEDDPRRGIFVLGIELRRAVHAQHGVAAGQRQRAFVHQATHRGGRAGSGRAGNGCAGSCRAGTGRVNGQACAGAVEGVADPGIAELKVDQPCRHFRHGRQHFAHHHGGIQHTDQRLPPLGRCDRVGAKPEDRHEEHETGAAVAVLHQRDGGGEGRQPAVHGALDSLTADRLGA